MKLVNLFIEFKYAFHSVERTRSLHIHKKFLMKKSNENELKIIRIGSLCYQKLFLILKKFK